MRESTRGFWRLVRRLAARDYREPATSAWPHDPEVDPHYWSTACQHNLHGDCRLVCEFCDAECRCICHEEATDGR